MAKTVTVTLYKENDDIFVEGLDEAIEWLESLRSQVPEEYRATAKLMVNIEQFQDFTPKFDLTVTYERPQTVEEVLAEQNRLKSYLRATYRQPYRHM